MNKIGLLLTLQTFLKYFPSFSAPNLQEIVALQVNLEELLSDFDEDRAELHLLEEIARVDDFVEI